MSKKIFRSIIAVAMVVLVSCLFIASSFLYDYFNKSQVTQLKEELSLVATNVDKVGTEYFDNFDSSVFRFTLVSADGSVLYDSQAKAEDMENHLEREEIAEALENGNGNSARYSSTLTERTFYEATRLQNGNVLRISVSQVTVGALILGMLPAIVAIILISAEKCVLIRSVFFKNIFYRTFFFCFVFHFIFKIIEEIIIFKFVIFFTAVQLFINQNSCCCNHCNGEDNTSDDADFLFVFRFFYRSNDAFQFFSVD